MFRLTKHQSQNHDSSKRFEKRLHKRTSSPLVGDDFIGRNFSYLLDLSSILLPFSEQEVMTKIFDLPELCQQRQTEPAKSGLTKV